MVKGKSHIFGHEGFKVLYFRAFHISYSFFIFNTDQSRKSFDLVHFCYFFIFLNIDLDKIGLVFVLRCYLFQFRHHHFAFAAPGCEEIYKNWFISCFLQHFLECFSVLYLFKQFCHLYVYIFLSNYNYSLLTN